MADVDADWLLPGEQPKLTAPDVLSLLVSPPVPGTVVVTNYRFVFNPTPDKAAHRMTAKTAAVLRSECPLLDIDRVEVTYTADARTPAMKHRGASRDVRLQLPDGYTFKLELRCKTFRTFSFGFRSTNEHHTAFTHAIRSHCFPTLLPKTFAFFYEAPFKSKGEADGGWLVYDARAEYERQGCCNPNSWWRLTDVNRDYGVCASYPAVLAVPKAASDDVIRGSAKFRKKGRVPALSYKHPFNQATICRAAQPGVGFSLMSGGKRSQADEQLVALIKEANPSPVPLHIIDARPRVNAKANEAKSGGYENTSHYRDVELDFMGIANIHVVRESHRKLRAAVLDSNTRFYSNLDSSGWLEHIRRILVAAVRVVELVEMQQASVLVHCSDGWDRTSQLTSLAMLMLDPYYRTVRGFQVLVEKEWLSFGHQFQHRIGHGIDNPDDEERSPVFLQFMECVWHVLRQFPNAFEFNEAMLLTVLDELFSGRFGTFLCDTEAQRRNAKLARHTVSLWTEINHHAPRYTNPLYSKAGSAEVDVLIPSLVMGRLLPWTDAFLRHDPQSQPHFLRFTQETNVDAYDGRLVLEVEHLRVQNRELADRVRQLEEERAKRDEGGGSGAGSGNTSEPDRLASPSFVRVGGDGDDDDDDDEGELSSSFERLPSPDGGDVAVPAATLEAAEEAVGEAVGGEGGSGVTPKAKAKGVRVESAAVDGGE